MEDNINDIDKNLLPEDEQDDNNDKEEKKEEIKIERLNENTTNYEESKKVIIIGDVNVGKSSILKRLIDNTFNENLRHSIALEHHNLVIKINSYILRLQIWDTVGQEKFDAVTSNYYASTDVAIFVYSIDNLDSFNKISNWLNDLDDKVNDKGRLIVKILIGNKNDLSDERKVSNENGEDFASKNDFTLFNEISCKEMEDEDNNKNINEIVEKIGRIFYEKYKNNRERLNSDSFNYKASDTVLQSQDKEKTTKRKCCCFC